MKNLIVSVSYMHWTEEDVELGDTDKKGWEVEDEEVDVEELQQMAEKYSIDATSSPFPHYGTWFYSTTPPHDTDFFEKGVEKEYCLHVQKVDGHTPSVEEMIDVGALIGAPFQP